MALQSRLVRDLCESFPDGSLIYIHPLQLGTFETLFRNAGYPLPSPCASPPSERLSPYEFEAGFQPKRWRPR